ncbi:hypothetical protein FE391_07000 [Nonomuraea sp. KC401]|uniref:DUF5946 family protein n=1 Tax=unclassified Nonomuraea TaxID=2593643 RepID=UPI0010FED17D|nr:MULTISPECIES: DUF5946 family protein [unclassified Nonomuraea]NBE93830.1 hypothetical protein [Nonomuraea sp. K271]TLF80667.1 hypothetical protein FE391_07000 [Nonomuraea sp. KC401]
MVQIMADSPVVDRCECGAVVGPLGTCVDYYHAILSEEQADPRMYRWHALVVCAYLLQHPSRAHEKYLDGQFRQLQLHVDQGLDALLRVSARQVARNKHGARPGYDMAPLAAYAPLPPGGPPGHFRATFCALPVRDGSFVFDGHPAYGHRIETIAEATVESWRSIQA